MAKKQISIEYHINTTPKILFPRLSTAIGLSEWFADKVDDCNNVFTFTWPGEQRSAELVQVRDLKYVGFNWLDEDEDCSSLEFSLNTQELTGDLSLTITEFVEEGEEDEITDLWNEQILDLKRLLGA
ncbi:MAG: START-like domain-containing protein [Salinivirgaceae bacterium]|nr:START-like domain-containing protein [Salinivirgaceae bacterium]